MSATWAGADDELRAGANGGRTTGRRVVLWAFGSPAPDSHAGNQTLLAPPPAGRPKLPARARRVLDGMHPAVAVFACLIGFILLTAAVLIGAGFLMVHFGAHGRLGRWDEHVNQWFVPHRHSLWNRISGDFTVLADTVGIASVAALVTLVLLLRRWGTYAWLLVAGLTAELAVFLITNSAVGRPRPGAPHLGSTPSTSSWPSGHVAATTVLYGGMAVLVMVATSKRLPRIAAWVFAAALTTCVALSRIYRGEHHPTDTIAGLCLGLAALWTAIVVIQLWTGRARGLRGASSPQASAVSRSGPP